MKTVKTGLVSLLLLVAATALSEAQPAAFTVRIALVPQWSVNQHRVPLFGFNRRLSAEYRTALDAGLVNHVVFAWQRGRIERRWLVNKPVSVVTGPEAAALGGRGQFGLGAVRPPTGRAAWTEVDVVAGTGDPADVLLLEIGGEIGTITQVLGTLAVAPGPGGLPELPLRRAIAEPREGVSVVSAPFGQPIEARLAPFFRGADGVEFLVARSPVHVFADSGFTSNGTADLAIETAGEWREGDRVLIRIPLATLRAGAPGIVLGWKDRILKPENHDRDNIRVSLFR